MTRSEAEHWFLLGFQASGEGYNGEWMRGTFEGMLRAEFDPEWEKHQAEEKETK